MTCIGIQSDFQQSSVLLLK